MSEEVNINIVNKMPVDVEKLKKTSSVLDYWFFGRENEDFIYFEDTFLGVKNQILVKNLCNGMPEITVTKQTLWLDKFYAPRSRKSVNELIGTITKIKRIEKGYLAIHAATLSKNNRAILFAAYPNVGKTLSTLQLLKEGYSYLSDDTILVDRNGNAYLTAFPSAIGHNDFLKFIHPEDIGKLRYYRIAVRAGLVESNKLLNRLIKPPLISLGDLFDTEQKASVDTVCTLEIGTKKIEEISKERMEEKITKINAYALLRINNPLIWAYSYFNDGFSVEKVEKQERDNLSTFLDGCDKYYALSCNDWNWRKLFWEAGVIRR